MASSDCGNLRLISRKIPETLLSPPQWKVPFAGDILHDDLDSIVRDIREAHLKDKTTADPQPTLDEVKENFEQAIQMGTDTEAMIHEFCDKMQIPFEKISSEDFSAFLRILSLSKLLKNPNNMRGKAKSQPYYMPKKKRRR